MISIFYLRHAGFSTRFGKFLGVNVAERQRSAPVLNGFSIEEDPLLAWTGPVVRVPHKKRDENI